jgi:hypothetical protein
MTGRKEASPQSLSDSGGILPSQACLSSSLQEVLRIACAEYLLEAWPFPTRARSERGVQNDLSGTPSGR